MLFFIIFEFHGHRKAGLEDFLTNITRFGLATLTSECSGATSIFPFQINFQGVMLRWNPLWLELVREVNGYAISNYGETPLKRTLKAR